MIAEIKTIRTQVSASRAEDTESRWASLYTIGGAAALITAALTVTGVVTFIAWPPPEGADVTAWFALFQRNWLLGMLSLDLMMLLAYVTLIPVILALYVALRRAGESLLALAAPLGLVAIATYFASSRIFEMLALSRQYAAAATEAERSILAAAGQAMLTSYLGSFAAPAAAPGWNYQGTAFNVSFVLWCAAGVLFSVVMLRSSSFGRASGYVGVAGFAATAGLFVPVIGVMLSLIGLVLQLAWFLLVARGLFRLARQAGRRRKRIWQVEDPIGQLR